MNGLTFIATLLRSVTTRVELNTRVVATRIRIPTLAGDLVQPARLKLPLVDPQLARELEIF